MSADDRFRYKNHDNFIGIGDAALVSKFLKSTAQLLLQLTIPVVFISYLEIERFILKLQNRVGFISIEKTNFLPCGVS